MILDILKSIFKTLYKVNKISDRELASSIENIDMKQLMILTLLFSLLTSIIIYPIYYFSEFFSYLGAFLSKSPWSFLLYAIKLDPVKAFIILFIGNILLIVFNVIANSVILYFIPFLKRRTEFLEFFRLNAVYYPVIIFLIALMIPTVIGPILVLVLYLYLIYKYLSKYSKGEALGSLILYIIVVLILSELI